MSTLPVPGERVRVTGIMQDDPYPMEVGAEGTVVGVNVSSLGAQIDVDWDNGRTLFLLENDPYITF